MIGRQQNYNMDILMGIFSNYVDFVTPVILNVKRKPEKVYDPELKCGLRYDMDSYGTVYSYSRKDIVAKLVYATGLPQNVFKDNSIVITEGTKYEYKYDNANVYVDFPIFVDNISLCDVMIENSILSNIKVKPSNIEFNNLRIYKNIFNEKVISYISSTGYYVTLICGEDKKPLMYIREA